MKPAWIALALVVIPLVYIFCKVWYDTRKSIRAEKEIKAKWERQAKEEEESKCSGS